MSYDPSVPAAELLDGASSSDNARMAVMTFCGVSGSGGLIETS
jgi:hypothetical protein